MASVMGVAGEIPESALGFTLPHEHLFTDLSCYWSGQPGADPQAKVALENREAILRAPWDYRDNTLLDDPGSALAEVKAFLAAGGKSIVDCSPCAEMGRNPQGLADIARATGANLVMACGRYTAPSMTEAQKTMRVADLESRLLDEFRDGVESGRVKPGFLKVAFVSTIDKESEIRSLIAAGRVQKKIGCALAIHPHIWGPDSHILLDLLEEQGCDLCRVILCHQDYLGSQYEYLDSLARRGVFIEFDTFGCGFINDRMWQQSDWEKIAFVKKQIDLGNLEHVLISGDMCLKIMLSRWGGIGYVNIPKNVIPAMKNAGIGASEIETITLANPAKVFCH